MNQAGILIIGVIYNTYAETLRYLESLSSVTPGTFTLILVDNSDKPPAPGFLEKIKTYPFLHYFHTGKNMGYFGGAREGLKHYLGKYADYPLWILVTNVDIVFTPQFFTRLEQLGDPANLGVLAPAIISKRWNADYNPKITARYSKKKLQFYLFLYSSFLFHNAFLVAAYMKKLVAGLRRGNSSQKESDGLPGRKIYAPHGSCLVFHRNYFARGGTLDLPNFLFGEEVLVGETALQAGLDVAYYPGLVIYDYEHASTGFFVTPVMNRYNREAIRAILDRYYR